MAITCHGVVRGNVVELPPDVQLPDGAEVTVVIGSDDDAWLKLAEATFARDWDNELDVAYNDWSEQCRAKAPKPQARA